MDRTAGGDMERHAGGTSRPSRTSGTERRPHLRRRNGFHLDCADYLDLPTVANFCGYLPSVEVRGTLYRDVKRIEVCGASPAGIAGGKLHTVLNLRFLCLFDMRFNSCQTFP